MKMPHFARVCRNLFRFGNYLYEVINMNIFNRHVVQGLTWANWYAKEGIARPKVCQFGREVTKNTPYLKIRIRFLG